MSDIFDLYQELIIDHASSPKNYGALEKRSHFAQGHNALCGDIIDVSLLVEDSVIVAVAFSGEGCAISKASASLMTESIKGKTVALAHDLFVSFHGMLTNEEDVEGIGKLKVLKGVRQFPMRVKCATLCWHTMNAALSKQNLRVTTE